MAMTMQMLEEFNLLTLTLYRVKNGSPMGLFFCIVAGEKVERNTEQTPYDFYNHTEFCLHINGFKLYISLDCYQKFFHPI
jgi:hypothetical protein